MNFEINSQDKAFLKLAAKVATGQAADDEKARLESLIRDQPRYVREFGKLQREFANDMKADLRISALKIMLGKAKPAEIKAIAALKQAHPEHGDTYQDAVDFLQNLATREDSKKTMKIQPMPDRVRKELQSKLQEAREQISLRKTRLRSV